MNRNAMKAKFPRAVFALVGTLAGLVALVWYAGLRNAGMFTFGFIIVGMTIAVARDWDRKRAKRDAEPDDALNWWEKLEGKPDA